jgi:hypothetical protein
VPFIKVCLSKVPKTIPHSRIRFRGDSGFFSKEVIEFFDREGCGYAIVAKLYPTTIKTQAIECHFQKLKNGWEVGEFQHQPHRWKTSHRFVVIRRPLPEDPEEEKQLTLFKYKRYAYHVLVTNLKISLWRVWLFYTCRAIIEKNIRELLYDYSLGHIPTKDWTANVAFFHTLLLSYNIVHWFKRLYLPKEYLYATVDTIRNDFLVVPAKLIKKENRNILNLPKDYHYRDLFKNAFLKLNKLKI